MPLPRSAVFAVRLAALAAAPLGIWWLCVMPMRAAGTEFDIAQRSERADAAGDRTRSVILARENLRELDEIASSRHLAVTWYMTYAANCELLDRWDNAVDVYTRALRIDQRPEIYFNRGLDQIRLGQTGAGFADIVTAARFQPAVLDQIDGDLRERAAAAAGVHLAY